MSTVGKAASTKTTIDFLNEVYWENEYTDRTEVGFFIRYKLTCRVVVVDRDEMYRHKLSLESKQGAIIDLWREKVLKPKLVEMRYSFRYMLPAKQGPKSLVYACRVLTDDAGETLYSDPDCMGMVMAFREVSPLEVKGLKIYFYRLDLHSGARLATDHVFIEENYAMIKLRKLPAPEESSDFRRWEESCVVAMLRRRLQLEAEFKRHEVEQSHAGRAFSINTRIAGTAVELHWEKSSGWRDNYRIQGYQKEGGGFSDSAGSNSDGMCVVDSTAGVGTTLFTLSPGRDYYYTFVVTQEEPVYDEKSGIVALLGSPKVVGTKRVVQDSVRFKMRMPTANEIQRLDDLLLDYEEEPEQVENAPQVSEKTKAALEELVTFVEFDEYISDFEKQLSERIKSKAYTEEEKSEKISRLKDVVESLRVRHG